MFDNLKKWVVEQVLWAEQNMKGKSGKEKRQAVVDKLDSLIPLPWFLEWMDGPLIGWLVDKACSILNDQRGHEWDETLKDTDDAGKAAVVELMPDVEAYTRDATEVMAKAVTEATAAPAAAVEKAVEKATAAAPEAVKAVVATAAAKATSDKLSAHFSKKEFACKCCGKFIPCPELVEKLEKFRALCGNKPMTIGSGTRCLKRNKAVGGAMPDEKKGTKGSQHLYGKAADVQKISGLTIDQMAKLAEQAGFNGIGKYNWGVHVDVRKTPARWDYRK